MSDQDEIRGVVALGSSAGGLQALEIFLRELSPQTGFAFIVDSHRAAGSSSVLRDLLQGHTLMPVLDVEDGMSMLPNHIYIAPPMPYLLTIDHGVLGIEEPDVPPRFPIDDFFRRLAADQGRNAVAVVLSGSNADGARGIEAIKSAEGIVLAQSEEEAVHPEMPRSAASTGLVDFVLSAAELAFKINDLAEPAEEPVIEETDLAELFQLVAERTGTDFSTYKRATLMRRIGRRMAMNAIGTFHEYLEYLRGFPSETSRLFQDLLIGVTSFLRDPEAWDALVGVLKKRLAEASDQTVFRAWIAGCSTGEEAYGLGMLLMECLDELGMEMELQLFATDINPLAIETARRGQYPVSIVDDVGPRRLERFFTVEGPTATVGRELRSSVVFAPHDLLSDPPFTRLDLITCRNVLIYFEVSAQTRLLALFHHALRAGGILFLGSSESVGPRTSLFEALDHSQKIYARRDVPNSLATAEFVTSTRQLSASHQRAPWLGQRTSTVSRAERILLESYAPAAVFVDGGGMVAYVHGRTGKFLEPAPGPQTAVNLFDMARDGLRFDLADIHRQALANPQMTIVRRRVPMSREGEWVAVDVDARVVEESGPYEGHVLISFRDSEVIDEESATGSARDVSELERRLRHMQESRQAFLEELETANEELKSTNEELQSTNEELQSANEELESSREEMHLLNEELHTVNDQLRRKVEELERANDDVKNLINSTNLATIFVNTDLEVISFTPSASKLVKLIPSDIGRPLSDLSSHLSVPIAQYASHVLETLVFEEVEVEHEDGSWYLMRIHPYRTSENVIDGLVISFVDISQLRRWRLTERAVVETLDSLSAGAASLDEDLEYEWCVGAPFGVLEKRDGRSYPRSLSADDTSALLGLARQVADDGRSRHETVPLSSGQYHVFLSPRVNKGVAVLSVGVMSTDESEE